MQPAATRIRDDIHDLREQTETLEELATHRIRIPHDGGRGMTSAPTPINFSAADLLDHRLTTEMAVRETDELIAMSAVISGFSGLLAEKLLMLEGKTLENGGSIETERSGKY